MHGAYAWCPMHCAQIRMHGFQAMHGDGCMQVQHFADDPLNFVGDVRARTANEILKGFRDVQHKEGALALPILAIHGTADKITSYTVRSCRLPFSWRNSLPACF